MPSFQLTVKALEDLKEIARCSQKAWGVAQRNLYLKQFDDTFNLIAESPEIGKACDYIKLGYRKFPHSSHLIFYRIPSVEKIEIVRILHKSMDIESKF